MWVGSQVWLLYGNHTSLIINVGVNRLLVEPFLHFKLLHIMFTYLFILFFFPFGVKDPLFQAFQFHFLVRRDLKFFWGTGRVNFFFLCFHIVLVCSTTINNYHPLEKPHINNSSLTLERKAETSRALSNHNNKYITTNKNSPMA